MPQFEIDLPEEQASGFDRMVENYVVSELICRPDIDIVVSKYSVAPGVQHRAIYMSSSEHLGGLRRRWESAPKQPPLGR